MRSKLFSMQLFVLAMALICCSFPSYGQSAATDSSKTQVKPDTTTLAKKVRAQTQTGVTATPRHSESDQNYIGTVANIGTIENRGEYYFKDRSDAKSDIFYSNAPMYVAENGTGADKKVSMLVLGTMIFDDDAQVVQTGETSLTGDFISVKEAAKAKELFVDEVDGVAGFNSGTINFIGRWNKQLIKREHKEGFALNSDGTYRVPEDGEKGLPGMVLNFPRINVKKEGVSSLADVTKTGAGSLFDKTAVDPEELLVDYSSTVPQPVELPTYDFTNMGYVAAASNVAVSVKTLDITGGNRFTAEMMTQGLYENNLSNAGLTSTDRASAQKFYQLNSAYLDIVEKLEDGNGNDGYSEVAMKLYNFTSNATTGPVDEVYEGAGDSEVKRTNSFEVPVKLPGVTTPLRATFLRGITSPFQEKMRADYMLYHLLTTPGGSKVTGDMYQPVGPPDTEITAGKGYLFAMDASREKFDEIIELRHSAKAGIAAEYRHDEPQLLREKGGYFFSRLVREIKYNSNYYSKLLPWRSKERYDNYSYFSTLDETDPEKYEPQRFNVENVTVELIKSPGTVQFLANPFMTPITLKELLGPKDAGATTTGGINPTATNVPFRVGNTGAMAVHNLTGATIPTDKALLRAKYWVVNTGLVATVKSESDNYYAYNIKYDHVDLAYGASTVPEVWTRAIEPLQVFAVQVANGGKFTFTNDMKIFRGEHKNEQFSRFPVSLVEHIDNLPAVGASATTRNTTSKVEAEETAIPDWFVMEAVVKDKNGGVVAMTADRAAVRFFDSASDKFDSDHDAEKILTIQEASEGAEDKVVFSPSNVLYTTTSAGDPLLGNAVNYRVKEIPLHYLPGDKAEDVILYFNGLDGFENINNVWLIDNFTGFEDKLYEGYEYAFSTQPNESYVGSKNRFTLVFDRDDEGPSLTDNPITCYYSGSILHIGGLNEKDLGSKVFIYDLQGRLMGSTIINNYPGMEYHKSLGQGTFIVKIVGNRNFDAKFVNLQNY